MSDKKKVVVIDDEPDLCRMLKKNLEATGEFEVVTTSDPKQAESVISQALPDVVLLDIVMPTLKGTDIVAALKKNDVLKKIPIIVISGKGEMIYHEKKNEFKWEPNNPLAKGHGALPDAKSAEALAQAYGVTDYISKPFTNALLLEVVNDVIAKARKKKAAADEGPSIEA